VGIAPRVGNRIRRYKRRASMAAKWANYTLGNTRPWTYPDRMYLESTNSCNLRCIMCPTGLGQSIRKRGFIDYDLFRQIVDEMAPHVKATTLHIWGEPLLHPRIVEMIAYCRERGLHAEISTNATLLTPEISKEILEAGLGTIYLCLDGTKPETYEKIRRSADFEQTKANILKFVELRRAGGYPRPEVKVQIIEIQPTLDELEEFRRTWSVPGVDRVNVKAFDSWGDQVEGISGLRPEKEIALPPRFHCPNLWYHVHIYWDGTLVSCDRDFDARYPLGNVANGVMKAWRGPQMAELRSKHLRDDLEDVPSCSKCVEWAWWKPTLFTAQGNMPVQHS